MVGKFAKTEALLVTLAIYSGLRADAIFEVWRLEGSVNCVYFIITGWG